MLQWRYNIMVKTSGQANYSDVHMTDPELAGRIVARHRPSGLCLEPFRGDHAFSRHLPPDHDWCEITEGRDFFSYHRAVNWIITNPPFSNLSAIFEHAFSISDHCVFLMPISKYFSSASRLASARRYGGLAEILHVGTGRDIGFDIGFPFAAMHFIARYRGAIHERLLSTKVGANFTVATRPRTAPVV
jgi:hypothetical protein